MSSRPTLRQLRAFEAAGRLESLTRAAVTLNLSQPALTQSIAKLERALGVILLERTRSGSFVTQTGYLFLKLVQRMLSEIELGIGQLLAGSPPVTAKYILSVVNRITDAHVRSLIAMADASSLAEAAGKLGLSEPSLQRSARQLEQIVGKALYQRSAHGTIVTRRGAELAKRFRQAMSELDFGFEEIGVVESRAAADIRVGTNPLCGKWPVAYAVNDLLQEFPDARFRLLEGKYESMLEDLRRGDIDIFFGELRKPAWVTDVAEEPFYVDPYCIAVRRTHPLARAPHLRLRDLASFEWVLPGQTNPRRRVFEQLFESVDVRPAIAIETSSVSAQKTILSISDRISLLTKGEIANADIIADLIALELDGIEQRRPEGVSTRRDWRPNPVQQRFIDLLRSHATAAPQHHGSVRALAGIR